MSESEITIKDLVDIQNEYNIEEEVAKYYIDTVNSCFGNNFKNKSKITKKYLSEDRSVIDKYLEDDYKILKSRIIHTRKMCVNRLEIERNVYTLDGQIELLNKCKNHKDLLIELLKLKSSKDYKERREFNIDIYYDIIDYLIENLIIEQCVY